MKDKIYSDRLSEYIKRKIFKKNNIISLFNF